MKPIVSLIAGAVALASFMFLLVCACIETVFRGKTVLKDID